MGRPALQPSGEGCRGRTRAMVNRRELLGMTGAGISMGAAGCISLPKPPHAVRVNDVHSQLNPTWVNRIVGVDSRDAVQQTIVRAMREGKAISIAGGRHAMGSQQFGTDAILLDTKR